MGFTRQHPLLSATLVVVFISIPSTVEFWWALVSSEPFLKVLARRLADMPDLPWLAVLGGVVSVALLGLIYTQAKKTGPISEAVAVAPEPTVAGVTEPQPPPSLTALDALEHTVVEGQHVGSLQVQRAFTPWRIAYPMFVRNRRPVQVEIVGFNATVSWDESPMQRVEWRAPETEASNAMPMRPNDEPIRALTLDGDHDYTLHVPLNGRQVGTFPPRSPEWTLRGTLYIQANDVPYNCHFNLSDRYRLPQDVWEEWAAQFEA